MPVFLNAVGKTHYRLLSHLFAPEPPARKSLDEIQNALRGHYESKPLVISERFNFHRRQQGQGETVSQYVAELRKLAIHCQFGGYLDEALRDRFVCGLRSESVQKKLLTKADLSFQEAIRIAQASEQAEAKARQLQGQGNASIPQAPEIPLEVGQLSIQRNRGGAAGCYRCGKRDHQSAQCRFKTARCHNCQKIGHIAPACRARKQQQPNSGNKGHQIKAVQEDESEDDDMLLNNIRSEPGKPLVMDIKLNGKPLTMELDTGAAVSLVSERTFQSLLPECQLKPSRVPLRTYSGERMEFREELVVTVEYDSQHTEHPTPPAATPAQDGVVELPPTQPRTQDPGPGPDPGSRQRP